MDHFVRGLSASWFNTMIIVIYGLVSVPLALHFLDVKEFGLFVLVAQIATYFALVEIGMTGATARILIDFKDRKEEGAYASVILNGIIIFAIQGITLLVIGSAGAQWVISAMKIDEHLADTGVYLLRWTVACFSFASIFKICGSVLYANQRLDILNAAGAAGILGALATMAFVLISGGGLRAMAYVFAVQTLLTVMVQLASCITLRLFPADCGKVTPSVTHFKSMFLYAKDVFLVNLSSQILDASQLILVGKTMGLTAAATWSVGTKLFSLLYQLLIRIEGTAIVFLSEMIVRHEEHQLRSRFRHIVQVSAALACTSLLVAAVLNKPFVTIWAGPELAWALPLSVSMAIVMFINIITKCYIDLILHSKQLSFLSYIYLGEAITFVFLALLLGHNLGFYGIITAAFICIVFLRYGYTSWRVAEYLDFPLREVLLSWMKRPILASCALLPFVFLSGVAGNLVAGAWWQIAINFVCVGLPAIWILGTIALPPELTGEIKSFVNQKFATAVRRV